MSEVLIQEWVAEQLACTDVQALNWQALSSDASFRRYFRCQFDGQSYIVALAPPATEKNLEFVQISALLNAAGIQASQVVAVNYEHGFILQNDLGQTLLSDQLSFDSVDRLYGLALKQLIQMQHIPAAALDAVPAYDAEALQLELSYFNEWFVSGMLNYTLSANEQLMLQAFFDDLCQSALNQPQGFVHRDYHFRNIMNTERDELAAIDFQDALVGPLSYDLVSLLRDCYVVWPESKVQLFVEQFWQLLVQDKLLDNEQVSLAEFTEAFDLMGLQRHIKVLGVFARLSLRDAKDAYLQDLPTVVNYVAKIAKKQAQHSETAQAFSAWFETTLMPLIEQQSWWTAALIEKNIMQVNA